MSHQNWLMKPSSGFSLSVTAASGVTTGGLGSSSAWDILMIVVVPCSPRLRGSGENTDYVNLSCRELIHGLRISAWGAIRIRDASPELNRTSESIPVFVSILREPWSPHVIEVVFDSLQQGLYWEVNPTRVFVGHHRRGTFKRGLVLVCILWKLFLFPCAKRTNI